MKRFALRFVDLLLRIICLIRFLQIHSLYECRLKLFTNPRIYHWDVYFHPITILSCSLVTFYFILISKIKRRFVELTNG